MTLRAAIHASGEYFLLALFGCLFSDSAAAQGVGQGTLVGVVVDSATKAPVPDIVVSASSPSLQGEQVGITDATGSYRIPQLPPGTYLLRFEKETYRLFTRGEIRLDADRTLRLNVELLPESLAGEEVLVLGETPVIDVGSTQTGMTITPAFVQNLPVAQANVSNGGVRGFAGLVLAAPGVSQDLFGLAMGGATSPENLFLVDGLNFNDTGYGVSNRNQHGGQNAAGSDFSVEFIDQMNVITGGYMPEYGRATGGVVSLVTKSGGDEFHGSVFGTWTPGSLAQQGKAVPNALSIINYSTKLHNAWDVGLTLGGYLVKGKLWFFIGFNPSQGVTQLTRTVSPYDVDASGSPIATGPTSNAQTLVPSATRHYDWRQTSYSYIAKLTYLINSNQRLSASIAGMPDTWMLPYGPVSFGTPVSVSGDLASSSLAGSDNTIDAVLQWKSSYLEKRLLLDVTAGWHHQRNNITAIDGSTFSSGGDSSRPWNWVSPYTQNLGAYSSDPVAGNQDLFGSSGICSGPYGDTRCAISTYTNGGAPILRNVTEDRVQGKFVLTALFEALGHHVMKGGLDIEWLSYENESGYAGGARLQELGPGTYYLNGIGSLSNADTPMLVSQLDQRPTALLAGGFLQDSWSIMDRVTINLGVRLDGEYIYDQAGHLALALNSQWSPRIGVIWDPTYRGNAKIYASYALYYEAVPLDLGATSIVGSELVQAVSTNCTTNPAVTGRLCPFTANRTVNTPGGGGPNQFWSSYGADKETIDPTTSATLEQEITTGVDYEVFAGARLGFNYTHRSTPRIIEDYSNNTGASFILGNPGYGAGAALPRPVRVYNAYTLALTKPMSNHWQVQVSYTYTSLNGNYEGLIQSTYGQLDPNINATFDFPQLVLNAYGPLPNDIVHVVKAFGSYQFVFGPRVAMTLGGAYYGRSGAPISALGGDPFYGPNSIFIIPRGTYGRLPWVHQLDLHLAVDVGLGEGMRLSVGGDCFNVLGLQQVTSVDQSYVSGTTSVKPIPNGTVTQLKAGPIQTPNGELLVNAYHPVGVLNPNFGHATGYQAPRSFRLLARVVF